MVFISPDHKPGHLRKIEDRKKPYSCVGHIGDYTTQLYHSTYTCIIHSISIYIGTFMGIIMNQYKDPS